MIQKIIGEMLTVIFLIGFTSLKSNAADEPQLLKMHATAYCLEGITASGKEVREGICASGRKELVGKTCILYQRLPDGRIGRFLGIYEIEDTGCNEYVIDVWTPENECQDFMDRVYEDGCGGKVYVQIIEGAKG